MDGLTISNTNQILKTGETTGQSQISKIRSEMGGEAEATGKSFSDTLKDAVSHVNTLQKDADVAMQKLATGENKNIAEVMIKAEQADISLKLMMSVRNKIIEAYQEIMKMQV